jgi:hypothetical protein
MAREFHLNGIKMDNLRRLAKRLPETQSEFINKKHEATSQARVAGFNKPVVENIYDKYGGLLVKHKFKAYQVFNCDETNNSTVMQPPNVIAPKGTKQVCP